MKPKRKNERSFIVWQRTWSDGGGVLDPRGLSRCSRYEYKIMTRCHYMQSLSLRKDSSSTANIRFWGAACVGVINSSLYDNHYNRGNMHQRKRGLWHFPACQCDSFPNTLLLQSPIPPIQNILWVVRIGFQKRSPISRQWNEKFWIANESTEIVIWTNSCC